MSFHTGKCKVWHSKALENTVLKQVLWSWFLSRKTSHSFAFACWDLSPSTGIPTLKLLISFNLIHFLFFLFRTTSLNKGGKEPVAAYSAQCCFRAQIRFTTQNMTDMFCLPITLLRRSLQTAECNWSRKLNSITMQLEKSRQMSEDCSLPFWQCQCLRLSSSWHS